VDALPPWSLKVGAHTNLEGDEEKSMGDLKLQYSGRFKQDSSNLQNVMSSKEVMKLIFKSKNGWNTTLREGREK
jgi:hypothetical protein